LPKNAKEVLYKRNTRELCGKGRKKGLAKLTKAKGGGEVGGNPSLALKERNKGIIQVSSTQKNEGREIGKRGLSLAGVAHGKEKKKEIWYNGGGALSLETGKKKDVLIGRGGEKMWSLKRGSLMWRY